MVNLLVKDSEFSGTNGSAPMAGQPSLLPLFLIILFLLVLLAIMSSPCHPFTVLQPAPPRNRF